MPIQYPVIVTVRDRLTPLRGLLDWLEAAGQREIWLCDNASTWPAMVEYLATTRHRVVRNGANLGHRAPWLSGLVAELGDERHFVVTDPDVVPDEGCPLDALDVFAETLRRHPGIDKMGCSLRIDDLPDHFTHKADVVAWESQFWTRPHPSGHYDAPIDTTFALYRPGRDHRNSSALRAAPPYRARHLPWYADSAHPTEEDAYYDAHSDRIITNWNGPRLAATVRVQLERLRGGGTVTPGATS